MVKNLDLDATLVEEARRIGGHKTKAEALRAALKEYVLRRKQLQVLDLFGKVEYDPTYDYKGERCRKRISQSHERRRSGPIRKV